MTLGERVKMLRQKVGLTQEELAKEIGYSTKTSISKIENDILDINQSTTIALARALKTTPSVIMGWEEVEENVTLHNTPQEEALLSNYRQLNPDGQKKVDGYVEDLVKGGVYSNTETKTLAAFGGSETVTADKEALNAAVEKLLKDKGLI